jgi:hypothetical protein
VDVSLFSLTAREGIPQEGMRGSSIALQANSLIFAIDENTYLLDASLFYDLLRIVNKGWWSTPCTGRDEVGRPLDVLLETNRWPFEKPQERRFLPFIIS